MSSFFIPGKYRPSPGVILTDRTWPEATLTQPPVWCAVDLRDGNQALIDPMDAPRKKRLFEQLVAIGFKQIEVGFPSASQVEFDFVRALIELGAIPDDVAIQVLTPAREPHIRCTFAALKGAPRAIVHLYNSTSPVQRRVVFGKSQGQVIDLAVEAAQVVAECAAAQPETRWVFEYSPESFTATEPEFALAISQAVMAAWQPSRERPCILNLPATVEVEPPHRFADRIEWMVRRLSDHGLTPERGVSVSLHPHNDRGGAAAAAELGLLAGAHRVEGTLFGNGERTGNLDLVTLAMNLHTQGIDTGLDFSAIDAVARTYEGCTGMQVHPRHPYAGGLVFTAFSGSHQDAIRKGLAARRDGEAWEVPYLPLDPRDVGRGFEDLVRINGQSGKGGIAHVMETVHGFQLPRGLQVDFSAIVQGQADRHGGEIDPQRLGDLFRDHYLSVMGWQLLDHHFDHGRISATIERDGLTLTCTGEGAGPLEAFTAALHGGLGMAVEIADYAQHAFDHPTRTDAQAAVYVAVRLGEHTRYGVALGRDPVAATLQATLRGIGA
ncbi:MAG: 2-isopropylmalate synthase [Alphaproteobacteria bacterium CG_4_10_14_0_2_um_filter_63_37]|nr:MAG: 2-isopropylmalate synthase [Proteobacteria bacterium CG1_02_64_396]PJA23767.1 MAG: 2-isopropylmalate synthase [Alphaproteobacteria bacterium CG_4_10_14_0_2_um_filter_63_37]